MSLADALRAAYAERGLEPHIETTDTGTIVTDAGYWLRFGPDATLVEGAITQAAYYALGLADEQTEGVISRAFDRAGYDRDAEQTRYSLDAIQAGRGPIYEQGNRR